MTGTSDLETGDTSTQILLNELSARKKFEYESSLESESASVDLAPDSSSKNDSDNDSYRHDPDPEIRHCTYFSDEETKRQCKERIVRITEKQTKCYDISSNFQY